MVELSARVCMALSVVGFYMNILKGKRLVKRTFRRHLRSEKAIFLKALVKSPLRTGAIIPSSVALGGFICRYISLREPGYVVEVGAGTGSLTKSLLNMGINRETLYVVEYEKDLCRFLQRTLPGVNVIHGNALNLNDILPLEVVGQAHTIISGIPLMNFSENEKRYLVEACLQVLKPTGQFLQFTYGLLSPLNSSRFGLAKERLGAVFNNIPPAIVWRYYREEAFTSVVTSSKTFEEHFVAAMNKIRRKVLGKF